MRGIWNRCVRATVTGWVLAAIVAAPAAFTVVPPDGDSLLRQKELRHPDLWYENVFRPVAELSVEVSRPLGNDLSRLGADPGNAYFDLRTGRWGTLILTRPLIPGPGVGNHLQWSDLGLQAPPGGGDLEQVAARAFRSFLADHAAELRIDPAELAAPRVRAHGERVIQIHVGRQVDGIPVRGAFVAATINSGNLVLVGERAWGELTLDTRPGISSEAAEESLARHLEGLAPAGFRKAPRLEILPLSNEPDESRVALGNGLQHRLVWVLAPEFAGDPVGAWEALVDAHDGELLAFEDTAHYAARRVGGSIYPVSNDGTPPDGVLQAGYPLPFADIALDGEPIGFTSTGGNVPPGAGTGTISTALSGRYLTMNDNCGAVDESAASGDLDLEGVNGTDCAVPAGHSPGDTNSTRSGYYEINRIMEQARGYLPGNGWLDQTLTANMNINQNCNASWNGSVNFFTSGGGCSNTGELAGVFDHEWGHGMDNNDNTGSIANPGEGIADIYAANRLNTSCMGRNFRPGNTCNGYGDPCTECTGVRDIDWAKRASGQPHDVAWIDANCGSGGGTPCGGSTHCEGAVYAEAVWDLVHRDFQGHDGSPFDLDLNTALELGTRLTYYGSSNVGNWFMCTTDGEAGCNGDGGYLNYLAVDDDNGDLSDGTPHMSAIFAAFDRHGIACSAPAVQNSGCAGGPVTAPANVTATPINEGAHLSWDPVAGASEYRVYRTEGVHGCDFGKSLVGKTTSTEFVEFGLRNDFEVLYSVVAAGDNDACTSPMSACQAVSPVEGPGLGFDPAAPEWTGQTGDGDGFFDNCETGTLTFEVSNTGTGALTDVRIVEASIASHPEAEVLTSLPATIAASLAEGETAVAELEVRGGGFAFNDTLTLTVTVTSDELDPLAIPHTYTLAALESDLQPEPSLTFSFEDGDDGWQLVSGIFDRTDAPPGGADGSTFYRASSDDLNLNCDRIRSPLVQLTETSTLEIYNQFDIENESGGFWWDRANLGVYELVTGERTIVSPDGGRTYNASGSNPAPAPCASHDPPEAAGWAGAGPDWQTSTWTAGALGSADYAGQLVQIDVAYGTDPAALGAFGFWFDEVTLTDVAVQVPDGQPDVCGGGGGPIADISPDAFTFDLPPDSNETQVLNVGNIGDADLTWSIDEAEGDAFTRGVPYAYGLADTPAFHAPVGYDRASGIRPDLAAGASADRVVLPAPQTAAVDELTESFDDITLLPGAGWALINNSEPPGPTSWFQGNESIFPAHEGNSDAYIANNYNSTDPVGDISNWLITPEVTIANGTQITFWTRTAAQFEEFYDRLEVRLSTAGASTDVGTTADSVGDFTELLLTINPDLGPDEYPAEWTQFVVTVSGISEPTSGRFAFRYWVTDSGHQGDNGDYIGIDTVSVAQTGGGACDNPLDIPWLSADPTSGTTPPSDSVPVDVTVDTTGLDEGSYTARLCVTTNDPNAPLIEVPVDVTVAGGGLGPIADITPESFAFEVPEGGSDSDTLNVGNIGDADLTWTLDEAEGDAITRGVPYAYGLAETPAFHAPVGYDRASGRGADATGAPADRVVLPAPQASAIDELTESFDDITLLPGAGWALINNSEPPGPSSWFQGNETIFPAHEGDPDAYIAVNYDSAAETGGDISNWMITPEVTVANGTQITFWTRTAEQFEEFYDRLEVRLSTAGVSTDVGTTADSVGDFTELLLTINPDLLPGEYPEEWTQFVVTVTGVPEPTSGRFAFRYWVTDSGAAGNNGDYIGIDTVSVAQTGACFTPVDIPWLSTDATSGTTPPSGSVPVGVAVDASALDSGTYTAQLCVNTNDPAAPVVPVPVSLTVTPGGVGPIADVTPESYNFELPEGDSDSDTLNVGNVGDADLTWSITTDVPDGVAAPGLAGHDPALDEPLDIPDFSIDSPANGGDPVVFTLPAGVLTQGDVVGFSFTGTAAGITGNSSWASDTCMIVAAPDGTTFGVGGISGTNPDCDVNDWDFQGSGSTEDGTYDSTHDDVFPGVEDSGDWTFTFINDWDSESAATISWTDVTVTLHKAGLPFCDDATAVDWLSVGTASGTTTPGGSTPVDVLVDTTGLAPGSYQAALCVATNDSAAPVVPVPVDLTVIAVNFPVADITPESFAFEVPEGGNDGDTLNVGNIGTADLVWSIDEAEGGDLRSSSELRARRAPAHADRALPRVAPLGDVLLDEGFEGGVIPPTDWTHEASNTGFTWEINDLNPHAGALYASVFFDPDLVPQDEWLLSPPMTLDSGVLTFWSLGSLFWCREDNDNCDLDVWIVVGDVGGDDDVFVGRADEDWPDNFVWNQSSYDLTDLLPGGEVRIGFQYSGVDGAEVSLDSITLTGTEGSGACATSADIPWLSTDSTGGTTPPSDSVPVGVTVDSTGLAPGTYQAALCVATNDAAAAVVPVPVTLTVTETPDVVWTPAALVVDPETRDSNGNDIFEPGEEVDVAPAWRNDGAAQQSVMGTASNFTGPAGPVYTLVDGSADYGSAEAGEATDCLANGTCYAMDVDDPATRPATHWDASFDEVLDDPSVTSWAWTLHIGDSFTDVPDTHLFYSWIETLLHNRVTAGCTGTEFCPTSSITRGQMAVFVLRGAEGADYQPEACIEGEERTFDDVPASHIFCSWIEDLAGRGVVAGCGDGNYCPADAVTRAQMAVFLLRTLEGGDYEPPLCNDIFTDVACPSLFGDWIEDLYNRGITEGCTTDPLAYCPAEPVTRGQMSVFVTKTFGLTLYGP